MSGECTITILAVSRIKPWLCLKMGEGGGVGMGQASRSPYPCTILFYCLLLSFKGPLYLPNLFFHCLPPSQLQPSRLPLPFTQIHACLLVRVVLCIIGSDVCDTLRDD